MKLLPPVVKHTILHQTKKKKNIIYGARAVNRQLPRLYHRLTHDWDVWSKNHKKLLVKNILTNLYNYYPFYIEIQEKIQTGEGILKVFNIFPKKEINIFIIIIHGFDRLLSSFTL